ncbi:MAG: molybdopterin-dependent oxidoreductase, partial [Methylococcales bacterium]|nr:molybdopterin-dependent oxidoreductase [Methylococcales bacterium]
MSDKDNSEKESDSTITPFRLPGAEDESPTDEVSPETFGERMKRRRQEVGDSSSDDSASSASVEARGWRRSSRHLLMMILESPHESATIAKKDSKVAKALEGIETVLFSEDIGNGETELGKAFPNEPLLANRDVAYKGQPVAIVVGTDEKVCREALSLIEIDYHTAPGILTVEHSVAMKSFHGESRKTERGDVEKTLASATNRHSGSLTINPQRPCFSVAPELSVSPWNHGEIIKVKTASLLPTEIRSAVAKAADISESAVELESLPLPGMTSALELEPVRLAVLATYAALKCRASIRVMLDSLHSPLITGKRHFVQGSF